ncbi:hypothetical protein X551_04371 [Methylibium sp. T29]|nr:hypothetical protein X551_04371 [Methylibium sp. T29]EWS57821.1 hypothetical protein Y694_04239 [Methylibium sp. T29-B]
MIFSKVDLPEPFKPSTPILAPGKKLREMSLRICRFGGTVLLTRFIVYTYWAMFGALFPVKFCKAQRLPRDHGIVADGPCGSGDQGSNH